MKVPYVGITVATAEKSAATDKELTNALLLPTRSPKIPHANDPIDIANKVMDTKIKQNYNTDNYIRYVYRKIEIMNTNRAILSYDHRYIIVILPLVKCILISIIPNNPQLLLNQVLTLIIIALFQLLPVIEHLRENQLTLHHL